VTTQQKTEHRLGDQIEGPLKALSRHGLTARRTTLSGGEVQFHIFFVGTDGEPMGDAIHRFKTIEDAVKAYGKVGWPRPPKAKVKKVKKNYPKTHASPGTVMGHALTYAYLFEGDAGEGFTTMDVADAAKGLNAKSIGATLSFLAREGVLVRVSHGVYRLRNRSKAAQRLRGLGLKVPDTGKADGEPADRKQIKSLLSDTIRLIASWPVVGRLRDNTDVLTDGDGNLYRVKITVEQL
jgi:hypothetical protein